MTVPSTIITFRPLALGDLPLLHDWLGRSHVAEWWGPPPSAAEVEQDFAPLVGDRSTTRPYIVLGNGAPIGYIQSYVAMGSGDGWWPDEQDPGVRGIDQFLAHAEQLGRGLGTAMVRGFVASLFADPAVSRVQTDPAPANRRAVRCYAKAGFRTVGQVDTPDGRALLMVCERAAHADRSHPDQAPAGKETVNHANAPRGRQSGLFEYTLPGGWLVLAGRTDAANEYLSLTLAAPGDLWFHIRGMPGSHVVLRVPSDTRPDRATQELAAAIAAYHSKARTAGTVAVSCTEARHVSKPRGAKPGTVTIRNETVLKVRPPSEAAVAALR